MPDFAAQLKSSFILSGLVKINFHPTYEIKTTKAIVLWDITPFHIYYSCYSYRAQHMYMTSMYNVKWNMIE